MTAIIGFQSSSENSLNRETEELHNGKKSSDALLVLINDILDLAKLMQAR
jgi:signal transduction histidine kinase